MKGKYCRHRGQRTKPRKISLCPENGTSQSPTPLTSLRPDGGPNSASLHAAQGGNQAQSRWLMLAHGELRHKSGTIMLARVWLTASSGLRSHNSSCLLIAHITTLRNSSSNPEKALCESRFHLIIMRYYWGQSDHTHVPSWFVDTATFTQQLLSKITSGSTSAH
jgi:hypothetical protein